MNEDFDGFDDLELGNALRRAAGTIPDADAAFGTFQRRVRVAVLGRRFSSISIISSSLSTRRVERISA